MMIKRLMIQTLLVASTSIDALLPFQSMIKHVQLGGGSKSSLSIKPRDNRSINNKNTLVMMPTNTPMVPWQPPGQEYSQWVDINSRLARDRILLIGDFIDESAANSIISTILYLRKDNKDGKISLYLNSPGGLLRPSLAVYDLICQCRDDCIVSTLNLGLTTGMGALICGAGTPGYRSAMPNSRFLLQRIGMESPFQGQASDIGLEVKSVKGSNDRLEMELAKMTGQTVSKIRNDMKRDFYLSSEEAVTYGLIDNVLLPTSNFKPLEYERDPWTGEKHLVQEREPDLGNFEGAGEEQRYQRTTEQESGGGWGTGWKQGGGGKGGDNYEPPVQK